MTDLQYFWLVFTAFTSTPSSLCRLNRLLPPSIEKRLWARPLVVNWWPERDKQSSKHGTVERDAGHYQHGALPRVDRQKMFTQRRKHEAPNTSTADRNARSKRSAPLEIVADSDDVWQVEETETNTCNSTTLQQYHAHQLMTQVTHHSLMNHLFAVLMLTCAKWYACFNGWLLLING